MIPVRKPMDFIVNQAEGINGDKQPCLSFVVCIKLSCVFIAIQRTVYRTYDSEPFLGRRIDKTSF